MLRPFGNPDDDEPRWREWLTDLRDAPPWRMERPGWLREHPAAILAGTLGVVCLVFAILYLVVPPQHLPGAVPGHWQLSAAWREKATSPPTTTTTTTTTVPREERAAFYKHLGTLAKPEQEKFWAWVSKVAEVQKQEQEDLAIAESPPSPPFRRWDLAFIAAIVGIALAGGAWYFSETRMTRDG
jgi:hypothetical protein